MTNTKYFNGREDFSFHYQGIERTFSLQETDSGEWEVACDLKEFQQVFGNTKVCEMESLSQVLDQIEICFPELRKQMELSFLRFCKESMNYYSNRDIRNN